MRAARSHDADARTGSHTALMRVRYESGNQAMLLADHDRIGGADVDVKETKETPPSRIGKIHLSGYFHPDIKRSMRLVQAATNESFEALMTRALNHLFREHGVPVFDPVTGAEHHTKETTPTA